LVERFHDGRVIAVAVLDGEALGAADLGPRVASADGNQQRRARLNPARQPALLRMAEQCCAALQVEGTALVELVVSERQNEVVRGVDVAPLLAPTSLYVRIASGAGIDFGDLVETVLQGARLRSRGHRFGGDTRGSRSFSNDRPPGGDRRGVTLPPGRVLTPGAGPAGGTCALPH
jgi:hypothetical protein